MQQPLDSLPSTDDAGKATFNVDIDKLPSSTHPLEARIAVRMAEPGGRAVEHKITLPVTASGNMIGVKPLFSGRSLADGASAAFDVVVVAPNGTAVATKGLHYELLRVETHYQFYKRDGSWHFEPVKTTSRLSDGALDSAADKPGHIALPVNFGRYQLNVTSPEPNGQTTSVTFDAGWYVDASADTPDMLETALDKSEYRPGDTMIVAVTARSAGRLTLNVIGDKLLASQSADVKQAGVTQVKVPVGADWGSGAYIVATLRRPLDAPAQRMPGRAIGVQWFSIDRAAKTLTVDLKPPALLRPNTTLHIPVKIEGLKAGDEARIAIAAVDVGILNLTNYKPPSPNDYYLGQRALSAEIRDLYGDLIDGMQGTSGQIRTGGDAGAALQGNPPTGPPLSFFSGIVTVGTDGSADVAFDIPDFAGTVRVMAVAWTKDKVGQASTDVIVRDPVVLTATLPRFLLPGDRSTVHLDLDNVEGQPGDYAITLSTTDAVVAGVGATQKLTLRAKARGAVTIPVTASAAGNGAVKINVSGPGGFVLERNYTLAVRPPAQILARRTVKPIAKGDSVTLSSDMFADLVPGTGGVSISVGSSAALDAASLLAALDRYPYRCSEQITSRAMPLLYVAQLASETHLALQTGADERVRNAIEALLTRQDSTGSFGLWGVGGNDVWLDSYVTDFLTRARERKFAVPDTAFKLALDHLRNFAANTADPSKNGGTDLAYALYVLARNGVVPIGDLRYLADSKLDALTTPIAKAQVAAALALVGDRARAERVYAAALAMIDPQSDGWLNRQDYGSNLRDAAALVTLASESGAAPATVQAAVQRVEASRAQLHPTSTQEDAWLLLAASAMAKDFRQRHPRRQRRGGAARALPHHPRQRPQGAGESHQYRRHRGQGRGHGHRRAADAGARGGERLPHRAPDLHARRRSGRSRAGQAEHPARGGAQDHRSAAAIRPDHRRRLSAGRIRDRQSASRLLRRYRHAGVDHRRGRAGQHRVPRRPLHRRLRKKARRSGGVHRGLCGARGLARHLRAAAGGRRGHVPAGPLSAAPAAATSRSRRRNDASENAPHSRRRFRIRVGCCRRGVVGRFARSAAARQEPRFLDQRGRQGRAPAARLCDERRPLAVAGDGRRRRSALLRRAVRL